MRTAARAGLAARIGHRLAELGLLSSCGAKLQDRVRAAMITADSYDRMLRWEVRQIVRALEGTEIPVVLLKGAAYSIRRLPIARGRLVSDVDILVPRDRLDQVEASLVRHGWVSEKPEGYDARYYREWMHEIPPLRHKERQTIVDLHHTILPLTARLHPDPEKLLTDSEPIDGHALLRTLSPVDTVLHKATHLFYDGDLNNALRELVDLDGLLRAYADSPGFWEKLTPRSRELGLQRPLFYGLRYNARLLRTPIPEEVLLAAAEGGPVPPVRALMDLLVTSALEPGHPDRSHPGKALAGWLLYLRSHWLRMPPGLLLRHLATKAWMRSRSDTKA